MDKTETQVFPDPFVGNLLCFQKNLCFFFKKWVCESKHQTPKRISKKDKESKKKKRFEREIKKNCKKRHVYMYILCYLKLIGCLFPKKKRVFFFDQGNRKKTEDETNRRKCILKNN